MVGASAGGIEALRAVVAGLPAGLPAAVLVVVHVTPDHKSRLPDLLGRWGPLPAAHARDGEAVEAGRIVVAPPNQHLLVERGGRLLVRLGQGPKVNRTRPAADVLFGSAARACGPRVVGVVLSGMLHDGTAGLTLVKRYGGAAVVQDPGDAAFPSMPRSAIENVAGVEHVLPAAGIGPLLARLATPGTTGDGSGSDT